jgi:hypothetical protein
VTARVSRRRRLYFAASAIVLAALLSFAVILVTDVYLHGRFERSAGFNVWGYRGPSVGRKRPNEYRVAVLGGSTAYGYGVTWEQSFPAALERKLSMAAAPDRSFSVVNLAYNNEGAYSFKPTLEDYAWLQYDLVCLYEGYNDMIGDPRRPNVSVFRHESPVFRLTGYLPILPIVFKEKAAAMLSGGDSGALYRDEPRTVFRPGLATKTTAEVLRASGEITQSLERQLERVTKEPPHEITDVESTGCKSPWQQYCRSILVATEFALRQHAQVLVVSQPAQPDASLRVRHADQQREMAAMLERRFADARRVRYVNIGTHVDLGDPAFSFDRMHLSAAGNDRVAETLLTPVFEMATARFAGLP